MGLGKGIIVGRRCPAIQTCPRCGRMRTHHPDGLYKCPVPPEATEALRAFKASNGRLWKSKLRALSAAGGIGDPWLMIAVNMIGINRLDKIKLPDAPYVTKKMEPRGPLGDN